MSDQFAQRQQQDHPVADQPPAEPSHQQDPEGVEYANPDIDKTSADSFPASDPPSWTPERT